MLTVHTGHSDSDGGRVVLHGHTDHVLQRGELRRGAVSYDTGSARSAASSPRPARSHEIQRRAGIAQLAGGEGRPRSFQDGVSYRVLTLEWGPGDVNVLFKGMGIVVGQ